MAPANLWSTKALAPKTSCRLVGSPPSRERTWLPTQAFAAPVKGIGACHGQCGLYGKEVFAVPLEIRVD